MTVQTDLVLQLAVSQITLSAEIHSARRLTRPRHFTFSFQSIIYLVSISCFCESQPVEFSFLSSRISLVVLIHRAHPSRCPWAVFITLTCPKLVTGRSPWGWGSDDRPRPGLQEWVHLLESRREGRSPWGWGCDDRACRSESIYWRVDGREHRVQLVKLADCWLTAWHS